MELKQPVETSAFQLTVSSLARAAIPKKRFKTHRSGFGSA